MPGTLYRAIDTNMNETQTSALAVHISVGETDVPTNMYSEKQGFRKDTEERTAVSIWV